MNNYQLITVEGNTGAGKTSLARMLSEEFEARLILEEFVDNPFLPKFYAEPERYAFTTEVFFLLDRHKQLKELMNGSYQLKEGLTITDYVLNKTLLYAEVNLKGDEYLLFKRLFQSLYADLPSSELIVYIHSSVPRLIQNIRKRGRGFEQVVRPEYLQQVEDLYFNYFEKNPNLTVAVIEADDLDFVGNKSHYEAIREALKGDFKKGVNRIHI